MKAPSNGFGFSPSEGERKNMHSELWHACAGPLISLPPVGSLVVYFPQGHSEQVAASMQKQADILPSYPNLPPKLICLLHNVTLHADPETDEVYAQMTLQPVNKYDKEALLASDMGLKQNRQPSEFFCKTLTASDTSTHGGFSVPRRAAEKIFPPLDFSMQPPAQEIVAKDIHDSTWTFRHIYRGQPKRHLLTTGWSVFVSTKRLFAGDSVLFIRDEKSQLLLGIRRANRQQPTLSSSVISSDSMHIGILAAAAHAAANSSPFTIFYNPRASPSEFVVPLAKYNKAMYTQVSLGMRFRMLFETEECGVRRYMGTITGITDLDPVRWKNSQWRNLQVGWDESTAGDRPSRVSMWDIEPVVTPFYICPPPFFRPKFPRQPGMPEDESDMENAFKRAMPWLGDEFGMKDASSSIFPGLSLVQWMGMQQNNQFGAVQSGFFPSMVSSPSLPNNLITDDPSKLLNFQSPGLSTPNLYLNKQNPLNQLNQAPQTPPWPQHQQSQLQHQHQRLQHQQQQQLLQGNVQNNGLVASNHGGNPNMHQSNGYSQSQSQSQPQHMSEQLCTSGAPTSHNMVSTNKFSSQLISSTPELQFQQHMEQHHQQQPSSLLQRSQQQQSQLQRQHSQLQQQQSQLQQESALHLLQRSLSQKSQHSQIQPLSQPDFSKQQLQLQQLQKLQQQQEQSVSPGGSVLQQQQHNQPPSLPSQSLAQQQNQQSQQMALSQAQSPPGNCMTSKLMQPPQISMHKAQNKLVGAVRASSGLTDGDAPSRSTSPTGNNNGHGSSSNFFSKNQQGPALLASESVFEPTNNLAQELHSKQDHRIRQDLAGLKGTNQLKYKGTVTDQLDVSSSGTSYMDVGTAQQNLSFPTFGLDSDVQSHPRNNMPFATHIDALTTPETLLSRGYGSQKDFQNMLPNYGGSARDIETELSSAAISSQSFGVPNIPFNPGCSNDVAINDVPINDAGVLNGGMWGTNQTQRMRTYTKVQKRGSVGRSIDVTRYRGYDELRQDLGRMFGIEGLIEDPQTCDWKLVYVDHENDILLVGDDPWEEFVNCVQSIKILSSAEVQQMSLDGDLAGGPVPNQACSGTDSENAWKIHYDDNSAVSFNR